MRRITLPSYTCQSFSILIRFTKKLHYQNQLIERVLFFIEGNDTFNALKNTKKIHLNKECAITQLITFTKN
jgi:sulfur relay (sulfurtransferase) complex TusBCD TusD component (DsrE family)